MKYSILIIDLHYVSINPHFCDLLLMMFTLWLCENSY